jgi:hypothetical protein
MKVRTLLDVLLIVVLVFNWLDTQKLQGKLEAARQEARAARFETAKVSAKLAAEFIGCNSYVSWLKQCLDGRTCTDNLPSIPIHREFPEVTMPNRVVPWEQGCVEKSIERGLWSRP